MESVSAGSYTPLFGTEKSQPKPVAIAPFLLDRYPVTVGEYLKFVESETAWRRSQARKIFVDEGYLKSWQDDLQPSSQLDRPITEISWFAAKAYCQKENKRLPTVSEWEYVALASETVADAQADD